MELLSSFISSPSTWIPCLPFFFLFNGFPFLYSLLATVLGNESSLLATPRRERGPSQGEESFPSYNGSTRKGHRPPGITLLDGEPQAEGTLPADSVDPRLAPSALVC